MNPQDNTWYPGSVRTASTTARAAKCCKKGILLPSLELSSTWSPTVNMAQPRGLSQAFLPRPGGATPAMVGKHNIHTPWITQLSICVCVCVCPHIHHILSASISEVEVRIGVSLGSGAMSRACESPPRDRKVRVCEDQPLP